MPFSKGVGVFRDHRVTNQSLLRLKVAVAQVTTSERFASTRLTAPTASAESAPSRAVCRTSVDMIRPGRQRELSFTVGDVLRRALTLLTLTVATFHLGNTYAGWSNLGTHPGAAAQRTAQGRALTDLELVARRLYAGYGDYDANTGPIPVYSYNVRKKRFRYENLTMQTEAIYKFRDLPGGLWALGTDPRGHLRHHFSRRDRKWSASNGLDRVASGDRAEHVYDMVQWRGALWAAGGTAGRKGAVWRSADNGKTWQTAKTFSPISRDGDDFTRVYWMGVLNDELYVQPVDGCRFGICVHPTSTIFNGERWREGPDILQNMGVGAPADVFANTLVVRTNDTSTRPGMLHVVKGEILSRPLGLTPVRDYVVASDGYLYALIAQSNPYDSYNDQVVVRTNNLINWECLFKAPRKAISIEAYTPGDEKSVIYVGMTNSRIKKRDVDDTAPCPVRQPRLFRSSLVVAPGTSLYNIDNFDLIER